MSPEYLRDLKQEIKERKQAEDKIANQSKMQQIYVELASVFINIPLVEVHKAIGIALAAIGNFFGSDRVYIFKYDWKNKITKNTHEWCA